MPQHSSWLTNVNMCKQYGCQMLKYSYRNINTDFFIVCYHLYQNLRFASNPYMSTNTNPLALFFMRTLRNFMRYFSMDVRLILHSKLNLKCCNLNYNKTIYIPVGLKWCVDIVFIQQNVLAEWTMLYNGYALTIALITYFICDPALIWKYTSCSFEIYSAAVLLMNTSQHLEL